MDLISPINASFNIIAGLDADPASGTTLNGTGEISLTGEAEVYEYAELGAVIKSKIAGAKSVNFSFSGKLDDANPDPVDFFGTTGIYLSGPVSAEVDFGDGAGSLLKVTGYLSSFETNVGGDTNAFSGEIAVTAEGTWV